MVNAAVVLGGDRDEVVYNFEQNANRSTICVQAMKLCVGQACASAFARRAGTGGKDAAEVHMQGRS